MSPQKNGNHGERRIFVRNDLAPHRCFIRALLNIPCRFVTLVGWQHNVPLAVCQTPTGQTKVITEPLIATAMQMLAAQVHKLNPFNDKDERALQKWSSHSLRIGACVILHTQGFSSRAPK